MTDVVLDASALLALLNEEPGALLVEKQLEYSVMSAVNVSEVIAQLIKHGMPPNFAVATVSNLGLRTVAFDDDMAYATAELVDSTKGVGLSLGDRACLALAQKLGCVVLTSDKAWAKLNLRCKIKLIR
ncbi:MAG: type II toxin-antitoxin system VapC family toxin [Candidatus Obscuribacterales bacterium]|nr:type II toxin-antitoxin system VapC family toxin [Candidatus Obscuribacterales bacterium]